VPRHENPLSDPVDSDGRLSAQLRQSRKAAGLGLGQAARLSGWSSSHLSQVENGKQVPTELLVLDLDVLYEADGLLLSLYEEVFSERRQCAFDQALRNRRREAPIIARSRHEQTLASGAKRRTPAARRSS
jgi:transcriptional regulator with XRE-family HTH domain